MSTKLNLSIFSPPKETPMNSKIVCSAQLVLVTAQPDSIENLYVYRTIATQQKQKQTSKGFDVAHVPIVPSV